MSDSVQTEKTFDKGKSWGALRKCWKGYRIAKVRGDEPNMRKYAERIRNCQRELGIAVAEFPALGLTNEA